MATTEEQQSLSEQPAVVDPPTGWSSAMCAAWRGEESEELSGAALTAADPCGLTPLHLAAMRGQVECGTTILDAAPDAINVPDGIGRTPLIHAATGGHAEMIGLLLQRGAKLEWTGRDGKTALHWAVIAHRAAAVAALANAGASTQVRDLPPVERLLKPNMKEHDEGKTPHDYANERQGKDPIYKFLAEYLRAVEEAREAKGPAAQVEMPEMPWVAHARAVAAAQKESEPAAACAAPAAAQPSDDIFGDEDADDDAAIVDVTPDPAESVAAVPPTGEVGAEAAVSAADLDDLD